MYIFNYFNYKERNDVTPVDKCLEYLFVSTDLHTRICLNHFVCYNRFTVKFPGAGNFNRILSTRKFYQN